ncbi:MAG TPA: DUF882 domain-containing protein, partial [Hyphomicrobiaceae bacterium]|nr:DUF882 domain-containing protein [Hyphomicrobiaceae bacterium]
SQPIHIISGYRSRATNEMLRKTVGGQASESRHILGKAADVYFPDVPLGKIRYSALIHERGGVGYYPTSAMPFVHIDTDRVRHWPRLPRDELALLFPTGHTQHVPADGTPISLADARVAQAHHKGLAIEAAAFQEERRALKQSVLVADAVGLAPGAARRPALGPKVALLTPSISESWPVPAPRLVAKPRLADRPWRLMSAPTEDERQKLAELAAMAGQTIRSRPEVVARGRPEPIAVLERVAAGAAVAGPARQALPAPARERVATVNASATATPHDSLDAGRSRLASAPAFDDEFPEELSYRPFPLAPYLPATASPDDPALVHMVHPDAAMTLEFLDQPSTMPPMNLRPGQQVAQLSWAQKFKGESVALNAPFDSPAAASDRHASRTEGHR